MKFPIYLDYSATTPVDPRVAQKMIPFLTEQFGNAASRSHAFGWEAEKAVEEAREHVAALLNADPKEIIWTSGATEGNNLAIKGAANFYKGKGKHIVTMKTEHKAVLDTVRELERQGFEATYLDPEQNGLLDLEKFKAALRPDTVLVSVMMVNNEIGVIQPIAEVGEICRSKGIIFHCDAVQAAGKIPIDLQKLKVDLLTVTAHKVYGPKGIGALYVRRKPRVRIEPQIHGGGHERGLRSGTLPTHQIVGMGEAFRIAKLEMAAESERIRALRDQLLAGFKEMEEGYVTGEQLVAQGADALALGRHLELRDSERLAHADDLVRRERPRAQAALVAAAVDLRLDAHARLPAHVQRADALRAVDLVRGHGQEIHLQLLQVDGNLAGGLHRVAVKDDAFGPADLADLGDRLDHADLVVHHHHRHEDGIGAEGRLEFVQIEQAVLLRIEVGRHEALALELAHRVEHRLVLGLHRDDVLALALVEIRRALDGEVVAFGRARSPDDLLGIGVQQRGDVLARLLDRFLRFPAERMRAARRIAELLGEKRDHLLRHARIDRRGRRVIEVNREFHGVPVRPTPRLPCRACPEARSPIPSAPPAARRGRRASPNRGTRTSCR